MKKSIMIFLLFSPIISTAYGEEVIPISKTWSLDEITFDGKWSFRTEWKASSGKKISFDGNESVLRIAHQDDFIIILIESLSDNTHNRISDRAIVCFDSDNKKTSIPENDDYCFMASSGKRSGIILQGGSNIPRNNYFENIYKNSSLIATGTMSDQNDRYSQIPHETYEFKIPLEILGRSDNYGFYLRVYDNDKIISQWPTDIEKSSYIPSPNLWGNIVSPDKSLPEFNFPLLLPIIGLIIIVFFARNGKIFHNLKFE